MPLIFSELALMRNAACRERVCRPQHCPKAVVAYLTLQTIYSLRVSITGLPRTHGDGILKIEKESYVQKSDFLFSFLSLFIILAIVHKILHDEMKIFLVKI